MLIARLQNITLGHGGLPLIEQANLSIERGDRICLIGRNGAGKSTLLKLINGDIDVETGRYERSPALNVSYLSQQVPRELSGSVAAIVSQGSESHEEEWRYQHQVASVISKLGLEADADFSSLSGGLKRRVLLAKALVSEPDILLLDEPTNHLDIEAITWLEKFLLNDQQTFVMVTHDRQLMEKVASHIVEIDNGQLFSWRGSYQDYLRHKQSRIEAESKAHALFDKRLSQEETWIRQGIKARRTRNEGRVRALEAMRQQRSQRRIRPGEVNIGQQATSSSGKIVFEVNNISYRYDTKDIIKSFSTLIMRGDKIGIIGPNGSGKSTLLKLLLGNLPANTGYVKQGTQLDIAYFDQHRLQLDEQATVLDNVCQGSDFVMIGEQKKHAMSYLQDFLFSPQQARSLVKTLSGGERNRAMLARLFTKPSNLLILDEPTNDLDVETLELLEELLIDYKGTLLLVSHDRAFLNHVVTSTIVMEGEGQVAEYVGGYDDYLRQRPQQQSQPKTKPAGDKKQERQQPKTVTKLSYKEKRELESLPQRIEQLEQELNHLQQQFSDPQFYKRQPDEISECQQQLATTEHALEEAYARWEVLDSKA